jgi:hypothetical protein
MAIRTTLKDKEFVDKLTCYLDKLALLYYHSPEKFSHVYSKSPKPLLGFLRRSVTMTGVTEEEEDILDYCKEILGYQRSAKPRRKSNKKIYKDFTLRNPNDVEKFTIFLNKMVELLEVSPGDFKVIFPLCPEIFWDKIDDLRETSLKLKRDSAEFLDCLEKCKRLSYAYSAMIDPRDDNNINDDWYDESE